MSNKPRTEEQKLRRKYLAECKKKGVKPVSVEAWKAKSAKKTEKAAKAPCKKPCAKKPVEVKKAPVHIVHVGDIVKFEGFTAQRIINFALRLLNSAWNDVIDEIVDKDCKCAKKCAKKSTKK